MSYSNEGLVKNYDAGGTINENRIVKFGGSDETVLQAAAATDMLIGVATMPKTGSNSVAAGEVVDVVKSGIAEVVAGGTITRGALVTSDADGKAVAASPGPGVNNRVIGIAEASAVSGDVFPIQVLQMQIQGA